MALALDTEIETTTGDVLKISEIQQLDDDIFVYSILPSGRITISKIKSITVKPSCKVSKFTFKNGNTVIVDDTQDFLYHDGSEYTTDDKKFFVGCSFNPKNDRIYDHAAKLYYPSEKVAYETFNLYDEVYGYRNLLEELSEDQLNSALNHIMLIHGVTGTKEQLLMRLSIDPHLMNDLKVYYLSTNEVEQLCNHHNVQFKNIVYDDKQKELIQMLMENVPEEYMSTFEEYIDNLKNNTDILKIGELSNNTNIQDDITKDDLDAISLSLGYSFVSHLKSVQPMYGTQLVSVEELDDLMDCAIIELDNNDTIGLACGIFLNTNI